MSFVKTCFKKAILSSNNEERFFVNKEGRVLCYVGEGIESPNGNLVSSQLIVGGYGPLDLETAKMLALELLENKKKEIEYQKEEISRYHEEDYLPYKVKAKKKKS